MSKFKKEYSILPQHEGEDYHHHIIRTNERPRPCFLIPLITVTIILILSGAVTLTISLFFPETFSQMIHWTRLPLHSFTAEKELDSFISSTTIVSGTKSTGLPIRTIAPHKEPHGGSYDMDSNNFSADSSTEYVGHNSSSEYYDSKEDSGSNSSPGESNNHGHEGDKFNSSSTTIIAYHGQHEKPNKNGNVITTEDFEEFVRKVEQNLESMTGINKPELVIPLFMLVCFMTSLAIVSLCCCVMMKRRDSRRRKMFGKIITDLQTGDSKTVLLNQDMDD